MNLRVKCDWLHCAHGMAPAATEGDGCYAGDVTDPECPKFVTDEQWEEREQSRKEE